MRTEHGLTAEWKGCSFTKLEVFGREGARNREIGMKTVFFGKFVLVAGLVFGAASASAQQSFVRSAKAFGLIEFSTRGSQVTGIYPSQGGRLYGNFIAPRTVQGQWFEPKSDRPCYNANNGTYAWGSIIITNYGRRNMAGYWGYCNDRPTRPINFQ